MKKHLLAMLAMALSVLALSGCVRKVTVSFDSKGGSTVASIEVRQNKTIPLPTPTREGYIFGGWFESVAATGEEFINLEPVKQTMTLYAKWYTAEELIALLQYDVLSTEVIITGFTGTPNRIYIPEQLNGKPVARIADSAFENLTTLSKVIIKSGLREIGKNAFGNCQKLGSIELPDSIVTIKQGAFYGCLRLTEIKLPGFLTAISTGLFLACPSLLSLEIPYGVTSIGDSAFDGCYRLVVVTIPKTVTTIGRDAFRDCQDLEKVYTDIDNFDRLIDIMSVNNHDVIGKITRK